MSGSGGALRGGARREGGVVVGTFHEEMLLQARSSRIGRPAGPFPERGVGRAALKRKVRERSERSPACPGANSLS